MQLSVTHSYRIQNLNMLALIVFIYDLFLRTEELAGAIFSANYHRQLLHLQ